MADRFYREVEHSNRILQIVAHVLLMGLGAYPSPEAWANALLMRLDHDGYQIVPKKEACDG